MSRLAEGLERAAQWAAACLAGALPLQAVCNAVCTCAHPPTRPRAHLLPRSARREAERIQKELEEREQEELKAYMAARGRKVGEGEKLDAKAINQEVLSEQLKQQQELQRRLARLAKQQDHLERARREEEAPLLADAYQAKLKVRARLGGCAGGSRGVHCGRHRAAACLPGQHRP